MRVVGNLPEAEEIASGAFIELLHEKREIRERVAWLKKCAFYLALDKLRSNERRDRREGPRVVFARTGQPRK